MSGEHTHPDYEDTTTARFLALEGRVTALEQPVTDVWDRWENGPTRDPVIVPWANRVDFAVLRGIGVTHVLYPKADAASVPIVLLDAARTAGLKVVMGYRPQAQASHGDTIEGWFVEPDEPDGAASGTTTPKASPATINAGVRTIRAADPTRPVWLSLNMGVAWPGYIGRGTDTGKIEPYNGAAGYLAEADVVMFNVYPGSNTTNAHQFIWQNWELAATGIRNLHQWATDAGRDPNQMAFGHWCEAAPVRGLPPTGREPTPSEMADQVNRSLGAGARMIAFFPIRAQPAPNDPRYGIQSPIYREAMRSIIVR